MKLVVSPSPHIYVKNSTTTVMLDVLISLAPCLLAAVIIFGFRALLLTLVCTAACVFFEWCFEKMLGRENTIGDLSAAVTGVMLAFNLSVTVPLWQAVFGSFVAIVVVKQLFGGIGKNFANPAITARIIMLLSFSRTMTTWTMPDAVSGATPLAYITAGEHVDLWNLFIGVHGGCIGETCTPALLLGLVSLLVRKVMTWEIPATYIGTVFIFAWIFGQDPVAHVLAGGLLFGAIFMATDYVTSPVSSKGKIVFGIGCGLITILIRVFGNYAEGTSFAILFMNILTPYIDRLTMNKPFGGAAS